MLSAAEIARGVQGALGLLRRDPAALLCFDNTMEACLRSFRLMAVTAPFYVVYSLFRYADLTVAIDTFELLAIETMSYVINWLLFPVIFFEVARRRGWLDRYPRYIAALNWINLPGIVIALLAIAIKMIMPAAIGGLLEIALQALFFYWFLVATRLALGVDWAMSALLLALNWIPSFFLLIIVDRYIGVLAGT
ncbi:MAG: hypothetical protein GEV13_28085 [Rhodospirillales bacterium]|nr:hypothetical protein [Rhodospirillales bacterium]